MRPRIRANDAGGRPGNDRARRQPRRDRAGSGRIAGQPGDRRKPGDGGGAPIVILFQKGTASALDAGRSAGSRDIGAAGVFAPTVEGRTLTFRNDGGRLLDHETNSEWDGLGRAVTGPLAGRRLRPIVHADHFWFAMAAFYPEVRVWRPE